MSRAGADLDGFRLWPGLLSRTEQETLRDEIFARMRGGPLYIPRMPKSGAPMSVRMTNFGSLGWVTDKEHGYRYQATTKGVIDASKLTPPNHRGPILSESAQRPTLT